MIELRKLGKSFGSQTVLRSVDLTAKRGETLVIIGASGGGKSVILKHCIGLMRPDAGEVVVDGTTISSHDFMDVQTIRRRMGMLFQGAALFDSMNAGENIKFAVREHNPEMTEDELDAMAVEKLNQVHLPAEARLKMPSELSGGMKKRVALARAIAMNPEILLYDEPTTGLDPITADVINDLILDMQRELGVTSLVVTHDMVSAYKVANRIAMLHEGRIIFSGTPDEIRATDNPHVRQFINGQRELK
ncbi:MAG TPA: ABC transporter ATP-binding protein [Fibrobacteres bacterium]|nr:ABC transporter ATP-binding protein [Fibrobacterota bacterium]